MSEVLAVGFEHLSQAIAIARMVLSDEARELLAADPRVVEPIALGLHRVADREAVSQVTRQQRGPAHFAARARRVRDTPNGVVEP